MLAYTNSSNNSNNKGQRMTYFNMNDYKIEDVKDKESIAYLNGFKAAIEEIKDISELDTDNYGELLGCETGIETLDKLVFGISRAALKACVDELECTYDMSLVSILDDEAIDEAINKDDK